MNKKGNACSGQQCFALHYQPKMLRNLTSSCVLTANAGELVNWLTVQLDCSMGWCGRLCCPLLPIDVCCCCYRVVMFKMCSTWNTQLPCPSSRFSTGTSLGSCARATANAEICVRCFCHWRRLSIVMLTLLLTRRINALLSGGACERTCRQLTHHKCISCNMKKAFRLAGWLHCCVAQLSTNKLQLHPSHATVLPFPPPIAS